MKYTILLLLVAITCHGAEPEKPRLEIATVQVDRILNHSDYWRTGMINLNKETLEAVKKIGIETEALKKQIIGVKEEARLEEIAKAIEFNNRKISLFRGDNSNHPRNTEGRILSEVIKDKFSGRFALILQDTKGIDEKVIYNNCKIVDITDDVLREFNKALSERLGIIPDEDN